MLNTVTDNWSTAEQTDITDTSIEIDRCKYCNVTDNWSGADRQTRQTHRHSCRQRSGTIILYIWNKKIKRTFSTFYVPEHPFMHLIVCCWFLISSGWGGVGVGEARGPNYRGRIRGVEGWRGRIRRGGAEWLSYCMQLSGPSRAIKLLYSYAPPPPTVWILKPPLWALHLLGLSLANICVRTCRYAGMHP